MPDLRASNIPTSSLAEMRRDRAHLLQKGATPSRREVKAEKRTDEARLEKVWHKAIKKRDGDTCRWCERKVMDCLERVPERREHHHVSGRVVVAIRWDVRNGLQLCGSCHDRVTGKVSEKFLIHSKHTFTVDGVAYINANKAVRYQRVA